MHFLELKDHLLPCMNKKLFGVDCPGCGFQRSVLLLTKGDFVEAFHMFPAIYTSLLFMAAVLFHFLFKKSYSLKIILILGALNIIILSVSYIFKIYTLLNP